MFCKPPTFSAQSTGFSVALPPWGRGGASFFLITIYCTCTSRYRIRITDEFGFIKPQLDARRRRTKYGLMHHEKLCVRETPIRGLKVTQDLHKTETISSFGDKEQINKKCPGGALIAGASRVWEICQNKFVQGGGR